MVKDVKENGRCISTCRSLDQEGIENLLEGSNFNVQQATNEVLNVSILNFVCIKFEIKALMCVILLTVHPHKIIFFKFQSDLKDVGAGSLNEDLLKGKKNSVSLHLYSILFVLC